MVIYIANFFEIPESRGLVNTQEERFHLNSGLPQGFVGAVKDGGIFHSSPIMTDYDMRKDHDVYHALAVEISNRHMDNPFNYSFALPFDRMVIQPGKGDNRKL